MARISTQLQKIEGSPQVQIALDLKERVEKKLNFDGRYEVVHPLERMVRLSRLTQEESDFLGATMGWDKPYFHGVDWDRVPDAMLAEAAMGTIGTDTLQALYPAPEVGEVETQKEKV